MPSVSLSHAEVATPHTNTVNGTGDHLSPQTIQTIVDSVVTAMQAKGLVLHANMPVPESNTITVQQIPISNATGSTDTNNDATTAIAEDASNTVHQLFQGTGQTVETNHLSGTAPVTSISTYNLSPSALISDKLKQSIWNREFIELSVLLKPQQDTMTLRVSETNELIMAPKSSPRNLTLGAWLTAFTMYMDIYVQKFPDETSGLLTYINVIRDLDRGFGQAAFNFYDRTFRAHRQSQVLPWGSLHSELWLRATTLQARTTNNATPDTTNYKKRYCYDFNKPKGCSKRSCQYAHICGNCRNNHPSYRCFSKNTLITTKAALPGPSANSLRSNITSTSSASERQHSFRNNSGKK